MIHVIATVELVGGTRESFLEAFHENVSNVLAEDGCHEYGAAADIPTGISVQTPLRDHVVTVVEKWRDVEALKAHLSAPHMVAYRERVKDFVKGVTLQVMQPV